MSTVDLVGADRATGGGKAAPLAELARAGFRVPAGFVVPTDVHRAVTAGLGLDALPPDGVEARSRILGSRLPDRFVDDVGRALARITHGAPTDAVAVRSSSTAEDDETASAAGQHDSFLAVRGVEQVCRAILGCWASLWTGRAAAYRMRREGSEGPAGPGMAVLVQSFVDPDVSGIMFTGGTTVIEASWGVGEPVVGGRITPDSWRLGDSGILERRPGSKTIRTDRREGRLVTRPVPTARQRELCLTDDRVEDLHRLGTEVSAALGGPRDIEWAIAGDTTWVLQARPVTAPAPGPVGPSAPVGAGTLFGEPASPGVASGPVRLVRGPADFSGVGPGDILVCRHTDPAWTPLFTVASGVVTETGGVLSHAAIVARETGIPAVLAVPRATALLAPSSTVTVDGDTGRILLGEP
ncbi:Phosphoenolpyruvate synthase [Nocardiopsis dassonvillei]|uniref:PEP/pyruvate-binding domain-containing protein n=1 Tax=Nocardiopsis dassonvillei TaxID=2014 RepID=UPI003F554096